MRHYLLFFSFCFSVFSLYAQDTIVQDLENIEIRISPDKEIAFSDSKHYILDFHVGSKGTFLLLKQRNNYFAYSLEDDLRVESRLKLSFKPKQLFADCLGFLHILSSDSIYQLERLNGELFVYESSPISLYHSFFERCIAGNSRQVIFRHLENFNQTTVFYGVDKSDNEQTTLYRIEDSMLIRSAQDTYDTLLRDDPGERAAVSEIRGYDLEATKHYDFMHDQYQAQQFFHQIVAQPNYYPLFVSDDTTFVFDYMNRFVVTLNNRGEVTSLHPVSYEDDLKIQFDEKRKQFYVAFRERGAQLYGLLSPSNFEVIKQTKVTEHAHPQKAIIYDGAIYYLEKESVNDSMNKLYRQRIRF